MKKILEKIKEYNRIIIHGHTRPDGDCIGSQFGLYYIIKDSFPNKEVYVTGETSDYVSFVGKPTLIDESLFKGALSICVDCGNSERLSDKSYNLSDYVIKIDHHIIVEQYGDYQYVEEEVSSCAEIIARFYNKFKDELVLSKKAAEALYVGLLTDTGRFKYDSVSDVTFETAAILLRAGVDISYIDNKLSIESLNVLKLKGYCLSNFKMSEKGFAYILMPRKIIEEFGVTNEEAASLVSVISTIEECPIWALFIEYDNEIRIRLRSKGPEIATLANKFGGGGHAKASGAHIDTFDDVPKFIEEADKYVVAYKNSISKED